MSFAPIVPLSGLPGLRFIERTYDKQLDTFSKQPLIKNDLEYFKEQISSVSAPEDLVKDYRLMKVALGAFGLDEDVPNKAFIRKILDEGLKDDRSLANRLSDSRYKQLVEAFGFDSPSGPATKTAGFFEMIEARFETKQFERAVGEQSNAMRLALNAKSTLPDILASSGSENALWFRILGDKPLRQVFETALGLPTSFGQIDLDQQLDVLKEKAARQLDIVSVKTLSDPEFVDRLVERFLIRDQAKTSAASMQSTALTLLQGALLPLG